MKTKLISIPLLNTTLITTFTLSIILTIFNAIGEETQKDSDEWINLFDGKTLQGWVMFLPDPNADPLKTWYVNDGVLCCTGTPVGYIRTDKKYSNYRLQLEWRWSGNPGNSGVLLHVQDKDEVWPKSIEAQLMHENAGDFWVIGGTDFEEHKNKNDRRVPKKKDSSEKKPGEWNQYDIWCEGNNIKLYVNGVLQNEAHNCTVSEGFIALQSEGAPIEFRNIRIKKLK